MEKKDIVGRKRRGQQVIRELECGHFVVEPDGGRAKHALSAKCPQCPAKKRTRAA